MKIPKLMGILNLTEDSFSDGSKYLEPAVALEHARKMIMYKVDIIDIGAESTRPGANPIPIEIELQRILPILQSLVATHPNICISIDTRKAEVAKRCLELGAMIINDISALRFDRDMVKVMAAHPQAKLVLMHMQGSPETMQQAPSYHDVTQEVDLFFEERIRFCEENGISRDKLILDPGIGFGKNLIHNLTLMANLDSFRHFGLPLLLGSSRKSFINAIDPSDPQSRLGGTMAAFAWAMSMAVDIVRVHDVEEHRQFAKVFAAIADYKKVD